jgi:hypothetical protein
MASSSPVYRRSVSQPVARTASAPDPQIEVLYNLPSVRIVAFTTPSSIYRPSSSHGSPVVEDAPGTLPWVSRSERTIAVGMCSFTISELILDYWIRPVAYRGTTI